MAHMEDVYVDEADRFSIGLHCCAARMQGEDCFNDWCIERDHTYYCVTRHTGDGYGEIDSFTVDGQYVECFDSEGDALAAANNKWGE